MRLIREVRSWSAPGHCDTAGARAQEPKGPNGDNNWAGAGGDRPGMFWTLRAMVRGAVDQKTGYLCDIREIDRFIRGVIVPLLRERIDPWREEAGEGEATGNQKDAAFGLAGALLSVVLDAADRFDGATTFEGMEIDLSPQMRYVVMMSQPEAIRMTRAYEFCAAHRLYCADYSDEQNRRVFGKCSNPHGHGHNYVVEVTLRGVPDARTGVLTDLPALDRTVKELVIDRFDHKNLNVECAEFASLNPSVENIARVIFGRLRDAFAPVELLNVRVWETAKTSAECTAEDV
jgi:6-pyruvoyltetrahydropterin/6-carboxytetrahydropterin synthase